MRLLKWENNIFKYNIIDILYYIILSLFMIIVGYLSLGEGIDFDISPAYKSDGVFTLAIIKSIQENGFSGIWFNSRIGAPEVSTLIDFPAFSNIMTLFLWVMSWFMNSIPRIVYSYLILTFVLDGISMSFLLRKLKFRREVSFVISSLFAFAPYHFYRYLGHITLTDYMSVPIAIYLAFYILDIIENEKKSKIIICIILLGMGYGYYYAFGMIILAIAYLFKFIKLEKKKQIIKKLWIMGLLLFTIFVSCMPKTIYSLINGRNLEAGHRLFFEQELYGLKIINLLLPVSYSRIGAFRELTNSYLFSGAPLVTENQFASLGIVGSIGFIILCVMLIISFINKKQYTGSLMIDFCSFTVLAFVLTGTIGGFGEIFNWAITSQIRCWNRISIFIMGLSLMMIAVLLNQINCKKRILSFFLCSAIMVIGCIDQIAIQPSNWQEGEAKELHSMYKNYFEKVESSLNNGAMVYQLPYLDFPEQSPSFDYKHFNAYLFTDTLRWSYGGLRGRNLAAKKLYIDNGMSYSFLAGLKNAGFQAVYIDLDGYDNGTSILAFYDSLNIEPIVSEDKKLYVYDISKLEISEEWLVPGYSFVHMWIDKNDIAISEDIQLSIANGLYNSDVYAYEAMYNWMICNNNILDVTDNEYIDYLYYTLLNRDATVEERDLWINAIKNGESREKIFYSFLSSEEFKNSNGLIDKN